MSKALVFGLCALALSAASASAADLAAPGYGYGAPAYAAPGYGYAAPALAPAQGATTVVIVTPTAPPLTAGYYAPHPVPPEPIPGPIYDYAPGYGYDAPSYDYAGPPYGYAPPAYSYDYSPPAAWARGYWGRRSYGWQ